MTLPNVLMIMADQWRGQDQGWSGNQQVRTPHLDRLAQSGVAIRGACTSSPVCGPSRASLLTGMLPHRHGVVANDLPLSSDHPTLATALRAAGYRTGWIGKWHLDGLPRDKWVGPDGRPGIDYWAGVDCSHIHRDGHYYIGSREPTRIDFTGYEPEVQTGLAVDFLDAGPQPLFLTVAYGPPHDPYGSVPQNYRERYDPDRVQVRPNATDTAQQRETQRLYWSAISAIDDQLGRLLDALDERGLRDDTIVIVTSDHGDMLGSHGRYAKQMPYAESVSVPLVINWPHGLQPSEPTGIFGLVDLAPTVLGLLERAPIGSDGADLSGAVRVGGSFRDHLLIGNWVSFDNGFDQGVPEWRGYVSGAETYARRVDGEPWLLFDQLADPWQQRNLIDDPDHRDRIQRADDRLDALLAAADDIPRSADQLLTSLGLTELWNARERALRGDRARVIPAVS